MGVANISVPPNTSIGVPGVSTNTVWSSDVSCVGWEGSISACGEDVHWTSTSNCSYAAVICSGKREGKKRKVLIFNHTCMSYKSIS